MHKNILLNVLSHPHGQIKSIIELLSMQAVVGSVEAHE